jgi:hypothetical protein
VHLKKEGAAVSQGAQRTTSYEMMLLTFCAMIKIARLGHGTSAVEKSEDATHSFAPAGGYLGGTMTTSGAKDSNA